VQCGRASPCLYYRDDWFRFKVVRNPYDRAVSSFIHVMKYKELREKVVPLKDRTSLSFSRYVNILEKLSVRDLQGFAGAHGGLQSHSYERVFYNSNVTVFHEIVQAENPVESLARINSKVGTNFSVGFRAHHYAERKGTVNRFVGNMPWNLLENQIPSNYGLFYNYEIKLRVQQVYLWDILLYSYSFPYKLNTAVGLTSSFAPAPTFASATATATASASYNSSINQAASVDSDTEGLKEREHSQSQGHSSIAVTVSSS
jgi:hypothetical protein